MTCCVCFIAFSLLTICLISCLNPGIILIKPRCVCVRVGITRVFMRKVRKIEIWFIREKVFITICRVIENMTGVD